MTLRERWGRSRRGYVMITSMMSITVMAIMASSMLSLANASRRASMRRQASAQALNLAMGAVDQAVRKLKNSKTYSGLQSINFGPGTMRVTVTTPAGLPDRRILLGTGTVVAGDITVTRQVRATLDLGTMPPVFYNAFASKETFTINGNVDTFSTPAVNQGHIHSNQDIILNGSSMEIRGRATATGTISASGSPTVHGGMTSGMPPMDFPVVDDELKMQALANGSRTGDLDVNSASTTVQGKITGDLHVGSNGCIMTGVVWVTGDVLIDGPVTGKATLIADGEMELNAKSTYPSSDRSNLFFISTSTASIAIDLGGNRKFKGIVYAPEGGVRLHGTPELEGGVLAKNLTFSGNPDATKWTDFDDDPPPFPRTFQLRGWEEL